MNTWTPASRRPAPTCEASIDALDTAGSANATDAAADYPLWLGCESAHPLTWLPVSDASSAVDA